MKQMEYFRIVLSGIMALLVSVPMCVCGNSFFPESEEVEHSCCSHEHEEQKESNPDKDEHDCSLTDHDQVEYTYRDSEPNPTKQGNDSINVTFTSSEKIASIPCILLGGTSLRAPPDIFSHSTRSITYCIYRL